MAILVNIGQRGFVLKEGFVGPTQQVIVDNETATKLAQMYPSELKIVMMSGEVAEKEVAKEVVEEVKEEQKPSRGRKKKEVK